MAKTYYVKHNDGSMDGPLSIGQVQQRWQAGHISPDAEICLTNRDKWIPIDHFLSRKQERKEFVAGKGKTQGCGLLLCVVGGLMLFVPVTTIPGVALLGLGLIVLFVGFLPVR